MGPADAAGAAADPGGVAATAADIGVTVVYSPHAGAVEEVTLSLRAGSTVADAVWASGLPQRHATANLADAPVGVWGVLRGPHDVLREADRVELYRPLSVDPKEARRRRQRTQREAIKPAR